MEADRSRDHRGRAPDTLKRRLPRIYLLSSASFTQTLSPAPISPNPAMAAGGRVAPRRATDGFERVDALDSARRALAKARLFGGESVRERAVPLEAPGAKKKPSNAFNTSDDDAEHEQRREVRRLARVFARADRVFASWSL